MWHKRLGCLLIISILSLVSACASPQGSAQPSTAGPLAKSGYVVELGSVTAADPFETPPSILARLRFDLDQAISAAGLRPVEGRPVRRLRLDVVTDVWYQGITTEKSISENYSYAALISKATLTDVNGERELAQTTITTYNGFGSWTYDATERYHTEDIVRWAAGLNLP